MKIEKLEGFWKWVKIGFRKRIVTCAALIACVSLYNSVSFPLIRLAAAIGILITAELFVIFYVPSYLRQMGLMLRSKATERQLPDEISNLAKKMNLKIQKMKTIPNVCNAFARGNQLFVGEDLVKKLDMSELKAVCAHEFGHIKGRHMVIQCLYLLPIMGYLSLTWNSLPPILMELGLFAYMTVALIPLHWMFEKRADYAAVKYVGKKPIRSALLKLDKKETLDEPSESHPPTSKRLKWINEAKPS